jgi:hypothetical protein
MAYIKKFNSVSVLIEYVQEEMQPDEFISVVQDNSFIHVETGEAFVRSWETLLFEGEAEHINEILNS